MNLHRSIQYFTFALLCFANHAMAQEISTPSQGQLKNMTVEEYSSVREKMRLRLQANEQGAEQKSAKTSASEVTELSDTEGAYGKGYDARQQASDRHDAHSIDRPVRPERPERPRFDRPSR